MRDSPYAANFRMPAEWEPHRATWIAWPHQPTDWPGKFECIEWVYVDIVRVLSKYERVEIICYSEDQAQRASTCLALSHVQGNFGLHILPTDRSWLRDSAPTAVKDKTGAVHLVAWSFNGWAKYDNYQQDLAVPDFVASHTKLPLIRAEIGQKHIPMVLEGGAIETDGQGTLLTTEECLLSPIQERNPGMLRQDYQAAFSKYLGIRHTIWLEKGCLGDDTHGHIDDVARFVAPGKVVLSFEADPLDGNHEIGLNNLERLTQAVDSSGRKLEVIKLPMPSPRTYDNYRLPASYANFYIANQCVLVPTFNDENDLVALQTLAGLFFDRKIIPINCADLVLGLGTLHCLTQQEPAA